MICYVGRQNRVKKSFQGYLGEGRLVQEGSDYIVAMTLQTLRVNFAPSFNVASVMLNLSNS
jgi:hypothetical protein